MLDAIFTRRSVRAFIEAELPKETVELLLRAAMQAPTARNTQQWEFVVVDEKAKLELLGKVHPNTKMCREASIAIIVCGCPQKQAGVTDLYFPQDCAAATQNILLQVTDLGLGAVWCGVYPKEERVAAVRQILEIPNEIVPFNIIAIGVPKVVPDPVDRFDPVKVHCNKF